MRSMGGDGEMAGTEDGVGFTSSSGSGQKFWRSKLPTRHPIDNNTEPQGFLWFSSTITSVLFLHEQYSTCGSQLAAIVTGVFGF